MKNKVICTLAILLLSLPIKVDAQKLRGKIEKSIENLQEKSSLISKNQALLLGQLASRMVANMDKGDFTVVFVDQTNGETSQLAKVWLTTSLIHFDLSDNFNIESAGLASSDQPINLSELENLGFKVKNDKDNRGKSINVKYGSGYWHMKRKNIESLALDKDTSIKVYVENGLTEKNAEILFENNEAIAREMLYVASQINAMVQAKRNSH
ncbi:hypothetical protein AB1A65_00790 [Muricauda sp. ANG21]|uniref:hypothetical protein n=1 Tax=Allomuricauda sp. ANG21 TaxID=3042468 RepID=UPI00345201C3